MSIDLTIIGNVLIAVFLYNVIIKAIWATIIKQIMKSDEVKEKKKTFREEIKKKMDQ